MTATNRSGTLANAPVLYRSSIALFAFVAAACSDVQHRVPLEPEPGEVLVVAVVDDGTLEVARIDAQTSVRIAWPPGAKMVVWRFAAGSFVDASGRPLDDAALAALEVSTSSVGGCGRCTYDALTSPQRLSPGDVCAVPPFADVEVFENDDGPKTIEDADVVRETAARVFVRTPGACGCADPPLKTAQDLEIVQIDADEPRIAASVHHLFDDGTALAITPGHVAAITADGTVRSTAVPELGGQVLASAPVHDGLLLALDDPDRATAEATYVHVTKDLVVTRAEGLPRLGGPALLADASGDVYLAGVVQPERAPRHGFYRCTTATAGQYECTEQPSGSGTCDETTFDFTRGVAVTSTVGTSFFIGDRGQLYARNTADGRWECHPGLSIFNFLINDNAYAHDVVDGVALTSDGMLYVCSTGTRPTGASSRHVTGVLWSTSLAGVRSTADFTSPLTAFETAKAIDALCTSISAEGERARSLWGFGDFAIDTVAGAETARHEGLGQPWVGDAPELFDEAADPVLDLYTSDDWALAVTASRDMYRRAPGMTTFAPIYANGTARRGPMTALAPTEPGTIVAFGARAERYTRRGDITRETLDIAGYPPTPDSHADLALVSPGAPNRALVATHRALLWRCRIRGTWRTPCLPPSAPYRVSILDIDLEQGRVVDEYIPPIANPSMFIGGAALADDVFVLLDSRGNVFSLIGSSLELLTVEWDDPSTSVIELQPSPETFEAIDGTDGVAWLVGDGLVGRVAWRPERKLVVEGFWHDRIAATWTPDDGTRVVPFTVDAWCADRAIVMGIGTTLSGSVRLAVRPSHLEGGGPSLRVGPIAIDGAEAEARGFSKRLSWIRPTGALRFPDGTVIYRYDDGTIEPRGGPRHFAPFSYVGGHAVSGDFAVIGGEGERIIAVEPR